MSIGMKAYYSENPYTVCIGQNGFPYVDRDTVRNDSVNMSDGNSKVGAVMAMNFPIEQTCDHKCECYKDGLCYACGGHYARANNQSIYAENLAYFLTHTNAEWIEEINRQIRIMNRKLFRWFTCGDILNERFLKAMVQIAKENPSIKFWSYTKKYKIVNKYVKENGLESIPENLVIIFSHWKNRDGSYFPMDNPYDFPTSEFIPIGEEYLTETVTNICPCSDPNVLETCETCSHPCYELKHGQSMALLEHSTTDSKERDKTVQKAHKALKAV